MSEKQMNGTHQASLEAKKLQAIANKFERLESTYSSGAISDAEWERNYDENVRELLKVAFDLADAHNISLPANS